MIAIGIDPGLTGAIGVIDPERGAWCADLPVTALRSGSTVVSKRIDGAALLRLLRQAIEGRQQVRIFVEALHVVGSDRKNSLQTQTSLMRTCGAIDAVCDIVGFPAQLVPPQQWQAFFGLVGKKHEQRAPGELPEATRVARRLYPSVAPQLERVKDHNRGEALLIAHYGLRRLANPQVGLFSPS